MEQEYRKVQIQNVRIWHLNLETTVRPSVAFYNMHDEVERLVNVVRQIQRGNDF